MIVETRKNYPNVKIDYKSELGYLNMKEILKELSAAHDHAIEAAARADKGSAPPERGGHGRLRLTAMACPHPNLFTAATIFTVSSSSNSRKGLEGSTQTLVPWFIDLG